MGISNIESDQFPEALEGVHAVVHNASPIPGRTSPEELVNVSFMLCYFLWRGRGANVWNPTILGNGRRDDEPVETGLEGGD